MIAYTSSNGEKFFIGFRLLNSEIGNDQLHLMKAKTTQ